jgi:hypothetical protein
VTPADTDWTGVEDGGDDELAIAPTFARRHSRRPSRQEAKGVSRRSELESSLPIRQDPSLPRSKRPVCNRDARTDTHEEAPKRAPVGVGVGVNPRTDLGKGRHNKTDPRLIRPRVSLRVRWPAAGFLPLDSQHAPKVWKWP